MLKFSPANAKLKALREVDELRPYLKNKRKVYSLDLLSGHTCPYAKDCFSAAVETPAGIRIKDGKDTQFRCFSASQEVVFPAVYASRKHNAQALRACQTSLEMGKLIFDSLPKDVGIVRCHVAGDFMSQQHFDAWLSVAMLRPDILFYAYTKSLPYWVNRIGMIPDNLILTASRGGRKDDMIEQYGLRSVRVVFSEAEAEGLTIDHTDECACRPSLRDQDFALLLHGTQPSGSAASAAIKQLKAAGTKFTYAR